MSEIIDVAVAAARQAGALLKGNRSNIHSVDSKADGSLVTDFDRRAEEIVRTAIQSRFPGHAILGEEAGRSGPPGEYLWIIDPLDGTHNYIRGIALYGVSIGVMRGEEFVAGVIFMPETGRLYSAEQGSGAYCDGAPIRVSQTGDIGQCSLAYDSCVGGDSSARTDLLRTLAHKVFNIRMLGSSAANFTFLAEGTVDIVVEFDDEPWDFAAGVCLAREAGALVTDFAGREFTVSTRGYVASNGRVHDSVCSCAREIARQ